MTPTLESARLLLRPFKKSDAPDLAAGLNNLEVTRWLAMVPYPYTLQNAAWFIKHSKTTGEPEWAIVLKSENRLIGCTSLCNINLRNGTSGGGGIWLNAAYHGHGYGAEAFDTRARYAFEVLGLRRLENGFLAGNEASKRMQTRLGYKIEGLRRAAFVCAADGIIKDEYMTGLLREEWVPYVSNGK